MWSFYYCILFSFFFNDVDYSIVTVFNDVVWPCLGLSPIHTKNDNYKDNYISILTSERHRLFILSACASAALNYRAH